MRATWERIHTWLDANAPELRTKLSPGASPERLAAAERALGVTLPADYRESLLVHDGQRASSTGLLGGWDLMSLDRVLRTHAMWRDFLRDGTIRAGDDARVATDGLVRPRWLDERWIPFAGDGAGDHYALDLDPAPAGTAGQVVVYWRDTFDRRVLAPSFRALMERFADDLEAGRYEVERDEDGSFVGIGLPP